MSPRLSIDRVARDHPPHPRTRFLLRWALEVLVSLALALGIACGGGSSGNPAAPPGPPPPVQEQVTIHGDVSGFFDPSLLYQGSSVRIAGVGVTEIDQAGEFTLEGVPTGIHTITLTDPAHLRRKLRIDVRPGGTNQFGTFRLVEKGRINLPEFDRLHRLSTVAGPDGTARWLKVPTIRLDPRIADPSLHQGEPYYQGRNAYLNQFKRMIVNELPAVTGGFFSKAKLVIEPLDLSQLSQSCSIRDYTIYIFPKVGSNIFGTACYGDDLEIVRGLISVGRSVDAGKMHAYMGRTVVRATVVTNPSIKSVFTSYPQNRPSQWTAFDRTNMEYIYGRPAGSRSPDDTSHLAPVTGEVAQAGSFSGEGSSTSGTADGATGSTETRSSELPTPEREAASRKPDP